MEGSGIIARIYTQITTLPYKAMEIKKLSSYSVCALLFLLFANNIHAQVIPTFGIKGGVNFATFAQSDLDGYEMKPGVLLGAFLQLDVPLSPLSIQPEINYAQFGTGAEETDATIDVNYIQIPVLLKLSLDAPGGAAPNIFLGPYANFMLSAEVDGDGASVEIDEVVNETAFGIIIGAGIDTNQLELGLRVSAGASPVFVDEADDGERNLGVALTLGLKF